MSKHSKFVYSIELFMFTSIPSAAWHMYDTDDPNNLSEKTGNCKHIDNMVMPHVHIQKDKFKSLKHRLGFNSLSECASVHLSKKGGFFLVL